MFILWMLLDHHRGMASFCLEVVLLRSFEHVLMKQ